MAESGRERLKRALESLHAAQRECAGKANGGVQDHLECVRLCLEEELFGALSPTDFRRLRKAAGLSQEALARQLGRTLRQVARYEQGHTTVPHWIADRLRELANEKRDPSGS